jgi:hypothetical protein
MYPNYNNLKKTYNHVLPELQDYMFTSKNLTRFTKHIFVEHKKKPEYEKNILQKPDKKPEYKKEKDDLYKPKQKDSLFWCFYILKNGISNYEMEINNRHFVVEKQEKFKYIELFRKNKDILKMYKIKPLTELEDDLANKDKISCKTFFALCIIEKINILLVDKRKIYEITSTDIDDNHPVHIINRNGVTVEHHIDFINTPEKLQMYRDTYYNMSTFDTSLKSMGSYKLDELIDLCKKLDINIELDDCKKKKTKKDIYELLVLNF